MNWGKTKIFQLYERQCIISISSIIIIMVYFEWLGQNAITMVLLLASYFEKEKHLPKSGLSVSYYTGQ